MTELMQVIFEYARENVIPAYMSHHEYEVCDEAAESRAEALLQSLPTAQREQLEEYFEDAGRRTSMELEAAFQAGFALGLELTRL